ncbi:hypothetical protein X798_03522, partial [Onchocerca flexuosa]
MLHPTDGSKNRRKADIAVLAEAEETSELHMDEESPLPVSVTDDESDVESHDLSNFKLKELKRKDNSDNKDNQSTKVFSRKRADNTVAMSLA